MKPQTLQNIEASVGDFIVCVSEYGSDIYTDGWAYELVLKDGKVGIMTDCGYHATTSVSLFVPLNDLLSAEDEDGDVVKQVAVVYTNNGKAEVRDLTMPLADLQKYLLGGNTAWLRNKSGVPP